MLNVYYLFLLILLFSNRLVINMFTFLLSSCLNLTLSNICKHFLEVYFSSTLYI